MLPIHQMHRLVSLPGGDLYRHAVAQQLVGTQIRLIKGDASGIGSGLQLLQGGRNLCVRIAAGFQIVSKQCRLGGAIVFPLTPFAKVAIAEASRVCLIRE